MLSSVHVNFRVSSKLLQYNNVTSIELSSTKRRFNSSGNSRTQFSQGNVAQSLPAQLSHDPVYGLFRFRAGCLLQEFSDQDLNRLKSFLQSIEAKEVYLLFNNISMKEDALRFKKIL